MGKYLYVCPGCKHANEQHISYCVNCGQWMHSTIHPPKAIKKPSPGATTIKVIGIIGGIFIALFVIVQIFKSADLTTGISQPLSTKIDLIETEQYKITEFELSQSLTGNVEAMLDFTLLEDVSNYIGQMELKATFYNTSKERVATASALLPQNMSQGQTTTVKLKFDNKADIMQMNEVRIEIAFPTLLDTLEKLSESVEGL